ncbi:hypothetical protein RF11_08455 [Thelohanellus kitauei]|uniref:Uncharacterized protein n=1 Tax=Thelohanellus kitauei TaxID=669202 RepID=A0A0C2MJI6_THEKT|nr:hypothetical protein RF11_08455 [Thelohanellus kitauei]
MDIQTRNMIFNGSVDFDLTFYDTQSETFEFNQDGLSFISYNRGQFDIYIPASKKFKVLHIYCMASDSESELEIDVCKLQFTDREKGQQENLVNYNLKFDKNLEYKFFDYKIHFQNQSLENQYFLLRIKSLKIQFKNSKELCLLNKSKDDNRINVSFGSEKIELSLNKEYCENFAKPFYAYIQLRMYFSMCDYK